MALTFKRRQPASSQQQIAEVHTVPAPVGGLNARDSLAAMPETDAIVLLNVFPQPSYVTVRNGSAAWATGLPGWVETLMNYRSATSHKMFAISGTAVYDVSSSGAVGAAVVTGLTNARWEYTEIATPGGQFLYAANATDKPLYYDGSAWVSVDGASTPAITGVTTTTLRNPTVWKNRLWFVINNTLSVCYLPTQSIGGAASTFPLQEIFRLGGSISTILTCSLNNGSTFDDYIGFLTTEGELAIYQGTDPDFSSSFSLAGVYRFGRPIGRRCWFKVGADAVVICSDGFISVSKLIQFGQTGEDQTISYKILNLVNSDVQQYSANFGWEGQLYPLGNKIIINVPVNENALQYQYVMNTITKQWGKFSAWNYATFLVDRDTIYAGGSTVVDQVDTGSDDKGSYINTQIQPAFSYMDYPGQKRWTMIRPTWQSQGVVSPALILNTDYQSATPSTSPQFTPMGGAPWNTSPWNTTPWGSGYTITKNWELAPGVGFAGTVYMETTTNQPTQLLSIDYLVEKGGVL